MHSVFPGDVFDLEPGRLVCADPSDVNQIDQLLETQEAAIAIIDPPNGQRGRDLLTYLAALHIPRIICWRADLYPGTVSQFRNGHWIAFDPYDQEPTRDGIHYTPALMAYQYGGVGRRPYILHAPYADYPGRLSPGLGAHETILRGHPSYRPGQVVLICHDQSGGASALAARDLGLVPLILEPDPPICTHILHNLGHYDYQQTLKTGDPAAPDPYPQGREYPRR